jgi:phosphohistidine phosphatase
MARQLWLLRHADAEPHGTRADSERRLTERGERQARLAGAAIARMGVEFEVLLSSPKERALRTATLALQALEDRSEIDRGIPLEVHPPLGGGFDAPQALAALDALPAPPAASSAHDSPPPTRLLIVGHEPDLSMVVGQLTGGRIDLKKGGLAVVRIDGRSAHSGGELLALLRPSELALIADAAFAR